MPEMKRIICLANSRKLNGRCVAGKQVGDGTWVRPVSAREHEEVSEYERQYPDGSDPKVLDLIDIPLIEARPKGYQQENWLLDPDAYWQKAGTANWDELQARLDPPGPLWINGFRTNRTNDRIPLNVAANIDSSLRLIKVPSMTLSVFKPGQAFGNPKRRVQGRFGYAGHDYQLWVTDPIYEREMLARPDGDYDADGECVLTVSLGEPYNDACYKLIAAIIEHDGGFRS